MLQPYRTNNLFESFEFRRGGKVLEGAPLCGLTLRAAGSMRFRWNEKNPNRDNLLEKIVRSSRTMTKLSSQDMNELSSPDLPRVSLLPLQLDHTRIVYDVHEAGDTAGKIGDGIITGNRSLIPTITVADCMPLYLYEPNTEVFGIVHSGWKGTGIIAEAIELAGRNYGSKASDFCIVLGHHILDCCDRVN